MEEKMEVLARKGDKELRGYIKCNYGKVRVEIKE